MRVEVWFDYQDDDTESVVFTDDDEGLGIGIVPTVGDLVGVRESASVGKHMPLDRVVAVRHFFYKKDGTIIQEVHVMTSSD